MEPDTHPIHPAANLVRVQTSFQSAMGGWQAPSENVVAGCLRFGLTFLVLLLVSLRATT